MTAQQTAAVKGVDRTVAASPTAVVTDERLLCALYLLEEERLDSTGFGRNFGFFPDQSVNKGIFNNALQEAWSRGKFIVSEYELTIGGELYVLTVIVPAGRKEAAERFVQRLRATTPAKLMERWFPRVDEGAAVWLIYKFGEVIAWTFYDVAEQLLSALQDRELSPKPVEHTEQPLGQEPLLGTDEE